MPVISQVRPFTGHPGEIIAVLIEGDVLSTTTDVNFGPGIVVQSFHIIDDGKITVSILIEADTHLGPRDVIVETPTGYEVMPGGFTVN